ncbi:MAG: hypothetical protein P0116_15725 [Candidatus Nitrosocosmicus sp.]|nr:hypothetical protein [Candidatus Nitrosocosmicus sp.]
MKINKNKLSIIKPFYIILFVVAFHFSCNDDNPSKSNLIYELDTNSRYEWSYDNLENSKMLDIYMADSSNIFLTGYPNPLYYDGTNYIDLNLNDAEFFPTSLEGYDKQNVYIGGGLSGKQTAILKKIQGKSIKSYEIPDRPAGRIEDILIHSENEVYLATDNSFVYKLSSGFFTKYNVMEDSWWGMFYKDKFNDLYFINDVFPSKNNNFYYKDYYKLISDSFNLVMRDTVCMFCESDYSLFRCGEDLLKVNNEISYFSDLKWIKICDTRLVTGEKLLPIKIAGKSKDYFVCYSSSVNSPGIDGIFIWNGKWSWEKNLSQNWPERGTGGGIELKDKRIAFVIYRESPMLSQSSTVIKGILK